MCLNRNILILKTVLYKIVVLNSKNNNIQKLKIYLKNET